MAKIPFKTENRMALALIMCVGGIIVTVSRFKIPLSVAYANFTFALIAMTQLVCFYQAVKYASGPSGKKMGKGLAIMAMILFAVNAIQFTGEISFYGKFGVPKEPEKARNMRQDDEKLVSTGRNTVCFISPDFAMDLVRVPPGSAQLGHYGSGPCLPSEMKATTVQIEREFFMGIFSVTNFQWEKIMGEADVSDQPNFPKVKITLSQALDFCARLQAKMHGFIVRLPTELEWEYACRFGEQQAICADVSEQALMPVAWYSGNSAGRLHSVGMRAPNALGLFDMQGNSWQITSTKYNPENSIGPATTPHASTEKVMVARGGSFRFVASNCIPSNRGDVDGNLGWPDVGLRIVVEPSQIRQNNN